MSSGTDVRADDEDEHGSRLFWLVAVCEAVTIAALWALGSLFS
jgi:hypothetical protein